MKNRVLGTLMALAMVLALAGPAAAAWENDLVGVFYNPVGLEYGLNLGAVADLESLAPGQGIQLAAPGTLSLSTFGPGAQWSNLYFGAFSSSMGATAVNNGTGYFATTKNTPTAVFGSKSIEGFASSRFLITNVWAEGDPTDSQVADSFTGSGQASIGGNYGGINIADSGVGVANLASLPMDETVFYLWKFTVLGDGSRSLGTLLPDDQQPLYAGQLILNSDGAITYSAVSPVPVPGALVLLGSGLLALVGIRRKKA